MSKEKQSLEKLVKIFEEEKRYKTDMFFRNAFATACYLSLQGEDVAAQKILTSLFDWLGWDRRKTYFLNIKSTLNEHANAYASEISANSEVNKLFFNMVKDS
jgi:hypothetical protein